MTIEYINRPDYESLFNGCVGYWDFRNDAKDCINGNDGTVTGGFSGTTHDPDSFTNASNAFDENDSTYAQYSVYVSAGEDWTGKKLGKTFNNQYISTIRLKYGWNFNTAEPNIYHHSIKLQTYNGSSWSNHTTLTTDKTVTGSEDEEITINSYTQGLRIIRYWSTGTINYTQYFYVYEIEITHEFGLIENKFGMQDSAYDFNGTDDKITLGNIGNLRTVVLMVKLNSTSEKIFEGDPNAHLIYSNSGTLTYPDWDDAYVDGVNTNTIDSDNWRLICVTSTTDVNCTDIELGLNNTTYGNLEIDFCMLYSRELSAGEVLALYNITSMKPIYPYMRRTCQK